MLNELYKDAVRYCKEEEEEEEEEIRGESISSKVLLFGDDRAGMQADHKNNAWNSPPPCLM